MFLKSRRGQVQLPDKPFAKGGEGAVYDVVGNPDRVAKLYHPKGRTAEKERKILAMLSAPPAGTVKSQIAWPTDILHDTSGRFMGFLMPRIRGATKIDTLYSYDCRGQYNYSFYIQVAQNLCAAVQAVHSSGHVCGDLNPANICVNPKTALVTLVDTDSYHIRAKNGDLFRCPVCRPEYVPRELHLLMDAGENLRTTNRPTFTKETDYFAVGVHIFALLMNGCHPYACKINSNTSSSEFTIINNILNGRFPFFKNKAQLSAPIYAPAIQSVPQSLQGCMAQTFLAMQYPSPSARPNTQRWYDTLQELEDNLVQCPKSATHQHWCEVTECPFCRVESNMKFVREKKPQAAQMSAAAAPVATKARSDFWGTVGYYGGRVLGFILWATCQILFIWLLGLVPWYSLWWMLLRYLLFGIIAFLPLWIGAFLDYLFCYTYTCVGEGVAEALNVSRFFAYIVYGGGAMIWAWGSIVGMIFNPLLACLPVFLLRKLLPDATEDLIW